MITREGLLEKEKDCCMMSDFASEFFHKDWDIVLDKVMDVEFPVQLKPVIKFSNLFC